MNRRTNNGLRSPPSSSNNNRSNVPSMPGTPNSLHTSKVSFIQIEGNTERRIEPNSFMTSTKLHSSSISVLRMRLIPNSVLSRHCTVM